MDYVLGSLRSFRMADILGYFCTSAGSSQNGGLEEYNDMNHQGGMSMLLLYRVCLWACVCVCLR